MGIRIPLIYKEAPCFRFDIGTHTVKIVQLKKSGSKVSVLGYGYSYFPREAVVEGIIVDPDELASAIRPLLQKLTYGRLTSHRAIVGVPAAKLFTRTLQLPHMNDADLGQAVHYEVEQYVPVPISDLYVDYEIINTTPGKEGHIDVLMMAAPRAIIDSYIKLFDKLGLEIGAIEGSMTAVVRALLHSGDAGGSTLAMDIGSINSDLTIYDKFIPLTGSVPIGGETYTEAMVKSLSIKSDQANEIKIKFGIAKSGFHDNVEKALKPQLEAVAKEAKRVVKFYQDRGEGRQVKAMVISGGTASMPGLAEYFTREIGLPLTVADPWRHIELKDKTAGGHHEAPMYATAIGLAMRGLL